MSPALNASFALQCFKCSNAIELHNGIMFDFYPGLPHVEIENVACFGFFVQSGSIAECLLMVVCF